MAKKIKCTVVLRDGDICEEEATVQYGITMYCPMHAENQKNYTLLKGRESYARGKQDGFRLAVESR